MLKYLKNSEVSLRIGLNPFNWKWIPSVAYDPPTPFYPKRKTVALIWLGLQVYFDIDNGETDLQTLQQLFHAKLDMVDEDEQSEVGHSLSKVS